MEPFRDLNNLFLYPELPSCALTFAGALLEGTVPGYTTLNVTGRETISDDLFADASKHNPTGDWAAVFGLNVLPDFRRRGYAAKLVEKFIAEAKNEGRRGCILTCKEHLLHYYARFGFVNTGVSASVHGGATWYDMRLVF